MQAEILPGPERRRRWSAEEKPRIVAETTMPGTRVADVARRHGVSRGLLYTWRREGFTAALPDLVPIVMDAPAMPATMAPARQQLRTSVALVREPERESEVSLTADVRLTVGGHVDSKAFQSVLTALRRA